MLTRIVVIVLISGLMWSCGRNRVTQLEEQIGQPLSKVAVQQDAPQAQVKVILHQDEAPISGAIVEFSRAIAGQAPVYEWAGITDAYGYTLIEISSGNGYYQARAIQDRVTIDSWSSIPINAGYETLLNLPIGGKAQVTDSSSLPKETIVFSDLDWISVQVQNRIAQYIVEKGYGYPTDIIAGSTLPLFDSLRRGDTHVTMEIWIPNQKQALAEAIDANEVFLIGPGLGDVWQSSFVIPAYLQEQYPDLDSVDDLKDDRFKSLFATAETEGKARLMSCVAGWACNEITVAQVKGYGLSDHIHLVNPKDADALDADLYSAYEKREPWLGHQWGTNDPALLLDLVRLSEPAYSDECWDTDKACAYDATILIAVHSSLPARATSVIKMLRLWSLNVNRYKEIAFYRLDNPEASTNDVALWWLRSNADLWGDWVNTTARRSIQSALNANEIPNGWPGGK